MHFINCIAAAPYLESSVQVESLSYKIFAGDLSALCHSHLLDRFSRIASKFERVFAQNTKARRDTDAPRNSLWDPLGADARTYKQHDVDGKLVMNA